MRFTSCTNTFTLSNGTAIPCIGYGTFETPADEARTAVREALETGYRHIDTAAVYGNQEAVGAGIRDSGIPRDQLFVTSKLWNTERGYENTLKACEQTLNELGVDYLDLYLIHWPANRKQFGDRAQVKRTPYSVRMARFPGKTGIGTSHRKEPAHEKRDVHTRGTRTTLPPQRGPRSKGQADRLLARIQKGMHETLPRRGTPRRHLRIRGPASVPHRPQTHRTRRVPLETRRGTRKPRRREGAQRAPRLAHQDPEGRETPGGGTPARHT